MSGNKNVSGNERPAARLRGLDLLGVVLSSACLVHCTVLPAVLALLPILGSSFHLDERWHFCLTALIVPVAMIALVTGFMRHHKNLVLILGAVSLVMILGAHPLEALIGEFWGGAVGALGGCILISAHICNHRFLHLKAASCCCGCGCEEEGVKAAAA